MTGDERIIISPETEFLATCKGDIRDRPEFLGNSGKR